MHANAFVLAYLHNIICNNVHIVHLDMHTIFVQIFEECIFMNSFYLQKLNHQKYEAQVLITSSGHP